MKDLRISGLTKSFGSQQVLRGVDLMVPHGSFTAILGASGSGKTTLLRIVAGFERPDDGRITLGEAVVDDARAPVRALRATGASATCPRRARSFPT